MTVHTHRSSYVYLPFLEGYPLLLARFVFLPYSSCCAESESDPVGVVRVIVVAIAIRIHIAEIIRIVGGAQPPIVRRASFSR